MGQNMNEKYIKMRCQRMNGKYINIKSTYKK